MTNGYFNHDAPLARHTLARAEDLNARLGAVEAGFGRLPTEAELKQGRVTYATAAGAADSYHLTLPYPPTAYTEGMRVVWRVPAGVGNTGPSAVNVNGLGVKPVLRIDGTPATRGDLPAGGVVELCYDGTAFRLTSAHSGDLTLARDWAVKMGGPVAGTEYSAKHHATQAAGSAAEINRQIGTATDGATIAAERAEAAIAAAGSAVGSADQAAVSAAEASRQANAAAGSATVAAERAEAAIAAASSAAGSVNQAAASAAEASRQANAAAGSATVAAERAAVAITAADSTAGSVNQAAASAAEASHQASAAAGSATVAAERAEAAIAAASSATVAAERAEAVLTAVGDPDGVDALTLAGLFRPLVWAPAITAPAGGAVGVSRQPILTASPYRSLYGVAHAATRVQIATADHFTSPVVDVTLGAVTSYTVTAVLAESQKHYVRWAYQDADGVWSAWSPTLAFTTMATTIATPVLLSPTNSAGNVSIRPIFTSSAFSMVSGTDTHAASRWQLSRSSDFTVTVIDTGEDAVNKISFTSAADLAMGTTYYVRVMHKGAFGEWSGWSDAVAFTTLTFVQFFMNYAWTAPGTRVAQEVISKALIDGDGNIYVAGTAKNDVEPNTTGTNPMPSGYVAKFRVDGSVLWERKYSSGSVAGAADFTTATLDSKGNFIVAGTMVDQHLVITKWSSNGDLLSHSISSSTYQQVLDSTVDAAGNVYLTASSGSYGHLIKFSENMVPLWSRYIGDGQSTRRLNGVACDKYGNIIVVGNTIGNAIIAKFDANGNFLRKIETSRQSSTFSISKVSLDYSVGSGKYNIVAVGCVADGTYKAICLRFDQNLNVVSCLYSPTFTDVQSVSIGDDGTAWFACSLPRGTGTSAVIMKGVTGSIVRSLNDAGADDWLSLNSVSLDVSGNAVFGGCYLTDANWPSGYVGTMFFGTMHINNNSLGAMPAVPNLSWSQEIGGFTQTLTGQSYGITTENGGFSSATVGMTSSMATAKSVTRPKTLALY